MKIAFKVFNSIREIVDDNDVIDPEILESAFSVTTEHEQECFQVLEAIVKTDKWMYDPLIFENIVLVLNDMQTNVFELQGCKPKHIWFAIYIISQFRDDIDLDELVKGYIEFISHDDGFYIYPLEAKMESPVKKYMPELIDMVENKNNFSEFDLIENQASKLLKVIEYVKYKINKEDIR